MLLGYCIYPRRYVQIPKVFFYMYVLRYFCRNCPVSQVFVHHIPDKLAVSFDSSSSLLSSYKWFPTIGSKCSSVKANNEEISFFRLF